MKTLVIYAHPNHESLCYGLLKGALDGMESSGTEVRIMDLHQMQFDPVLNFDAENPRREMYRVPELEEHRQNILWAERLVLIYPIYWGRPPAMILGWIDRVFASNFAYSDNGKSFPEQLLKGKTAVCISTMKGPRFYPLFWLRNAHQILMRRALFGFVGIKKVKFFEFGGVEKKDGRQLAMIEKVKRYFNKSCSCIWK